MITTDSSYSTDAERWRAVASHDAEADGVFFYAVRTTGVFCRPSCASRQPRRENVQFFNSADDALAAGYRTCKRCQPGKLPRDLTLVQRACAVLDQLAPQRLTLAELSRAVHVSPFHLQRVFTRVVGVSPRQYQAARRGAALRSALHEGRSVTGASADAGYTATSRLYDAVSGELGMNPSLFRRQGAGLIVHYTLASTPLGLVLIAATGKGICQIAFGDEGDALVDALRILLAQAELRADPVRLEPFVAQVLAYLEGSRQQVVLPLDISATAFQQRVWKALQAIPYGETRSYSEIAAAIGAPRAVRAVASACAANPVALAIPCHRVKQKSGALAGFRWGLERKAALLAAEARATDVAVQQNDAA
ncbi:bifunctional DNA-binding transcriptional regulator/O6-methylguanine-DNA methyltransferase Ada [Paraburkholderia hayleyella]|uniref:bifunctional DNA-binding transcriptional regulator/O6-methylguanine-DNA methyltransferase Ada n=1 Tax=Paraburkholderia hayleyella TaxID=2152889 RepID=UPI0012922057|nr:bifunctional DNA-binding transcriptional regulator/O6-methylguanine-DNA methyltransferase Ada [Paraburkholderia hayleyella]